MALRFLGKDPDSPNGDSPSVWDDGDWYVVQGWRVTDTAEVAGLLAAANVLAEDIYADHGAYWYSWAERIAPVDCPAIAAGKIAQVLHAAGLPQ